MSFGLRIDLMNATHRISELEQQLAAAEKARDAALRALAEEWPDLDKLPEWTPEERAEMNVEYEEWVKRRIDARKDTERIDWREAHPKHGFGLYSDGTWADGKGGSHATYREAIDAARAATAEERK